MKKILIIILFCMSISLGIANAYKNDPDGFRNIKWGSIIDDCKNEMTYIRTESGWGGVDIYNRNNDNLEIGSAKLENIYYGFWQDKLIFVCIITDTYTNWSGILNSLNEKFGNGYKDNQFIEKYVWREDKTLIIAELNEITNTGVIYFTSVDILDKANKWEDEKAKEGAKKGF